MLSGLVKLKFISKSIEHTKYMLKVTLSVCPSVSNGIAKYDFSVAIQGIKIGGWHFFVKIPYINEHPLYNLLGSLVL